MLLLDRQVPMPMPCHPYDDDKKIRVRARHVRLRMIHQKLFYTRANTCIVEALGVWWNGWSKALSQEIYFKIPKKISNRIRKKASYQKCRRTRRVACSILLGKGAHMMDSRLEGAATIDFQNFWKRFSFTAGQLRVYIRRCLKHLEESDRAFVAKNFIIRRTNLGLRRIPGSGLYIGSET